MKRIITLTLFLLMTASIHAQNNNKILVTYFSWGGNTRVVANQVQKATGGDLFEIKTTKPYPTVYRECTDVAKKEQQENARPALAAKVDNMDAYDIIFVGYPNWWGTLPMPLYTFLESYDFSGKTIIPFCTHAGGRLGRSVNDIRKLCPESTVRQGLAISGNVVRSSQNDVTAWLRNLGMTK